jgi:GntR family transcriptional regulator, transcriptional repressor for pyruvate dehydrogenase complex
MTVAATGPSAVAIAERVRGRIHRGELGPGDRLLPERQLAEELGVGRLRLREALAMLEAEGYLVARRGASGGRFVTELSAPYGQWVEQMRRDLHELDHIVDFRLAVECQVARLAAQRCTKADITTLRAAVRALERATTPRAYRTADLAFHAALALAAKSPRLAAAVEEIRGELFSPADEVWFDGRSGASARDHLAIVEACVAGDADRAAAIMAEHVSQTRAELRALIEAKSG